MKNTSRSTCPTWPYGLVSTYSPFLDIVQSVIDVLCDSVIISVYMYFESVECHSEHCR